jgi:hypothetical protein
MEAVEERQQNVDTKSAPQLKAAWGRVGIQIDEFTEGLFEKSKKTVVGDGSYVGFVNAVLENVPIASKVSEEDDSSFGYLIYLQNGHKVSKRTADIMPGDIITLENAKLRGIKGIKPYHQHVGEGSPVVAIIREYRPRKSIVAAYQACLRVGTQVCHSVCHVSAISPVSLERRFCQL